MLTRKLIERARFGAYILFGIVLCFYLPPKIRSAACPSTIQDGIGIIKHNEGTDKYDGQSNIRKSEYKYAEYPDQKSNENENWFFVVFCGEMKLTDLALVFFTPHRAGRLVIEG
jgi:hypothetical protein